VTGILCGLLLFRGRGPGQVTPAWRALSFLSVVLLIATGVGVGYNIAAGGYPKRPLPYRRTVALDGTWRIDLPVSWEPVAIGNGFVTFADLLDTRIGVRSRWDSRMAGPGLTPAAGASAAPRLHLIDGRVFLEYPAGEAFPAAGGALPRRAHRVLHTYAGDRHYVIAFSTEARWAPAYDLVWEAILQGFEPRVPWRAGRAELSALRTL
jgi:hypothetical protein